MKITDASTGDGSGGLRQGTSRVGGLQHTVTILGVSPHPLSHYSTWGMGRLGSLGPLLRVLQWWTQSAYPETKPDVFCT